METIDYINWWNKHFQISSTKQSQGSLVLTCFNIQPMPNWLPNMTSTLLPTPASQTVAGHADHKSGSGFVPSRFLGHSGPLAALVRLVWKGPTPWDKNGSWTWDGNGRWNLQNTSTLPWGTARCKLGMHILVTVIQDQPWQILGFRLRFAHLPETEGVRELTCDWLDQDVDFSATSVLLPMWPGISSHSMPPMDWRLYYDIAYLLMQMLTFWFIHWFIFQVHYM